MNPRPEPTKPNKLDRASDWSARFRFQFRRRPALWRVRFVREVRIERGH